MTEADKTIRAGVAIVTGAGSGLGRALALELAQQGMQVVGIGRRLERVEKTAELDPQGRITALKIDISQPDQTLAGFARVAKEIGPVTLLINNAAIYPKGDLLTTLPQSFMEVVNINLGGVVACTHAALSQMCETGIGRILNVSTFADIAPVSGSAAYSVSKGAARIFTRALLADLADRLPDIVVNDWMPGMLATQMGIADGLDPAVAAKWGVKLALWHDPCLSGTVFEMNREILPPRSFKRKLLNKMLLRKAARPRTLAP